MRRAKERSFEYYKYDGLKNLQLSKQKKVFLTYDIGTIPFVEGRHRHSPRPECLVFELNLVNYVDFPFIVKGDAIILVSGPYVVFVSKAAEEVTKPNTATVKAMVTFIV